MGKKKQQTSSLPAQEKPIKKNEKVVEENEEKGQEKSVVDRRKPGWEIEELFANAKKRKKTDKKQEVNGDASSTPKRSKVRETGKMKKEGKAFVDPPSRPRRRTTDGLAIYAAEELGFGKDNAGGTPLCPFDCDCCF